MFDFSLLERGREVFFTSLTQNLQRTVSPPEGDTKLRQRRTRGGPSAVSQWGHAVQRVAEDYHREVEEEEIRTTSREATFPPNIVVRRQPSTKTGVGERENRPNGGKGWPQQPEADCGGQLHKITSQREKQRWKLEPTPPPPPPPLRLTRRARPNDAGASSLYTAVQINIPQHIKTHHQCGTQHAST